MQLRDYQVAAIDATFEAWESGLQRVAIVLPTGAGKTVTFSHIIREHLRKQGGKVLMLAHRGELLSQAANHIAEVAPDLRVGVVKAAQNQVHADVIVASQQTLQRRARRELLPPVGLVIVDETHRSMGESYQKVLEALGCLDPDGPRTLGVTATFTREDSRRLTDFFQAVPFSLDILELIDRGYLVPPKFKRVLIEGLDLSGVPVRRLEGGKDLAVGELDAAMERAGAPGVVAAAYHAHARDRSGLIFCPTVSSAEHVAEALREWGITSEALSGATPEGQRRDILARYQRGELQTVTNCAVLGEGFDAPITDCIVIARPTCSKILFRQQVGRGLRLHPGKTDCLVLDVVGATGRNDLKTLNDITDIQIDVDEGETVDVAAKRALGVPREEAIGEAFISGSLAAIDLDPWAVEWARGRKRKADGAVMTDEEIAEEERQRELERQQQVEEKERRQRRRYKHVPMRSGWFLRTTGNRYFIPLDTHAGQKGFVVVGAYGLGEPGQNGVFPDSCHAVALWLEGTTSRILKVFDSDADAATYALNFVLRLIETAMERYVVDPDARWRRKQASQASIDFADRLVTGFDWDEWHYQGQVSDCITWGKWHRNVDTFADSLAKEVKASARMTSSHVNEERETAHAS